MLLMSNRSNPFSARRFQDSCSMHAWAFLPLLLHQVAMPKPVSPSVHAKDDQHAKQASNVAANSFETRMDGLYAPSTPSHEHSIHVGFHATEHPIECLRVAWPWRQGEAQSAEHVHFHSLICCGSERRSAWALDDKTGINTRSR